MISKPKGTQDFLDLSLYNFVVNKLREMVSTYHFHEIATPIIESTELFKRSLGMYTDVVSKEMFTIEPHGQTDKEPLCLRPEFTASTVRAYLEGNVEQAPWRVYSYGPLFRYERPQKGRFRQFHQFNMEVIDAAAISYDAQLITMLDRIFHETFHLNNYALLINYLGCPADRANYRDTLKKFLEQHITVICETCKQRMESNTLRIFDCKNESCQVLYRTAPFIHQSLCSNCQTEWETVQLQLQLLSVSFVHQPTLVRGLDYYNGTAFEFVSNNLGAQNTFCGGGRYNTLVSQLSPKHTAPALGAAIGIERLLLVLEPYLDTLTLPQPAALQVIIPLAPAQHALALLVADTLTAHGLCTEVLFDGSLKSCMRKANKIGAAYVILIGQDEQESGTVTVKNMVNGSEERIAQRDLVTFIKKTI